MTGELAGPDFRVGVLGGPRSSALRCARTVRVICRPMGRPLHRGRPGKWFGWLDQAVTWPRLSGGVVLGKRRSFSLGAQYAGQCSPPVCPCSGRCSPARVDGLGSCPAYAFQRRRFLGDAGRGWATAAGLGLGATEHAGAVVRRPDSARWCWPAGCRLRISRGWPTTWWAGVVRYPRGRFVELVIRAGDEGRVRSSKSWC